MNHYWNKQRQHFLITEAQRACSQLAVHKKAFSAGAREQRAALRAFRSEAAQIRELLTVLSDTANEDLRFIHAGVELLCTAVRLSELVFSPSERIAWFEGFADRAANLQDRALYGRFLANYGNTLADAGRLDEAESLLKQRLAIAIEARDINAEALAQEHLGKLLVRRGRFADSEPLLDAAFAAAMRRRDEAAITRLLAERASVRERLGDMAGCLRLLRNRLRRCEKHGDLLLQLSTHQYLANRLPIAGRLNDAARHAQLALAIAKQLRLPYRQAQAMGTLGDIACDQNQLDVARRYIVSASRIFRRLGRIVMQANTATSLGSIACKEGRYKLAIRWHREALSIDHTTGRSSAEATDLANLASALVALGEHAEAIKAYQRCLQVLESLGDVRRYAEIQNSLSAVSAQKKARTRARLSRSMPAAILSSD
jgi:tetratricopeptide (TPR) repeat protein